MASFGRRFSPLPRLDRKRRTRPPTSVVECGGLQAQAERQTDELDASLNDTAGFVARAGRALAVPADALVGDRAGVVIVAAPGAGRVLAALGRVARVARARVVVVAGVDRPADALLTGAHVAEGA